MSTSMKPILFIIPTVIYNSPRTSTISKAVLNHFFLFEQFKCFAKSIIRIIIHLAFPICLSTRNSTKLLIQYIVHFPTKHASNYPHHCWRIHQSHKHVLILATSKHQAPHLHLPSQTSSVLPVRSISIPSIPQSPRRFCRFFR